jgi:hypothetical protein
MESFRCIQASRLLLDNQLHWQQCHGQRAPASGEPPPGLKAIIQDATLIAFENIVSQALARDVHCVLISGDSFDPDDRGLRGPAALVRGIQRLAERDIPVILQAGRSELWSSWPRGLRFPPNAHRLGAGLPTSVSIAREGKLLATVAVDVARQLTSGNSSGQSHAVGDCWQIHLPATDGSGAPTTHPIHLLDCGPAQALCDNQTGPHGCQFIEFDAQGDMVHTFVAAAPVRWERLAIDFSGESTRDDLLEGMASRLEQIKRHTCEKIWLVAWDFSGVGPLFERMEDQIFRNDLLDELAKLDAVPGVRILTHAVRTHPLTPTSRPIAEGCRGPDNNLVAEFAQRLEDRFADPNKAIDECLTGSALAGEPWDVKIDSLLAGLDAGQVAHDARRLAMHWFAGQELSK